MKFELSEITREYVQESIRYKSIKLTRDNYLLLGGVTVSEDQWLNQDTLTLDMKNKRIVDELTKCSIEEPDELKQNELLILLGEVQAADVFRVSEITKIDSDSPGRQDHLIQLQRTDGKTMYLRTKNRHENTFYFTTQKTRSNTGFTVRINRVPTVYSTIQIGGKSKLTEFQLSYEAFEEQSL